METLIRIAVWLALTLLILVVNVWFFRSLWQTLRASERPRLVAPFVVAGRDDQGGQIGRSLAGMLSARLPGVRREVQDALRALEARPETPPPAERKRVELPELEVISTQVVKQPARTTQVVAYDAPEIPLNIGGVDVGGILDRLHRFLASDRMYRFTVYFQGDKRATLTGALDAAGKRQLFSGCEGSQVAIVERIAHALVQQEVAVVLPEVRELKPDDFESLVGLLRRLVQLNRELQGETPETVHEESAEGDEENGDEHSLEARYGKLLEELTPFLRLEEIATWRGLFELAAGVAENAGRPETARRFYDHASQLVPDTDPEQRNRLQSKVAALEEQIEVLRDDVAARRELPREEAGGGGSGGAATLGRPKPPSPAVAEILARLEAVRLPAMVGSPKIAVLGGLPDPSTLGALSQTIVGDAGGGDGSAPQDRFLRAYVSGLVQAAARIAPRAEFIFTPSPSQFTQSEILNALERLLEAEPQILLVAFGPLPEATFTAFFAHAAERGVLSVLTAGNEPGKPIPFAGSELLDRVLVVAATDRKGEVAPFTSRGDGCFWAPGVNVVVRQPDGSDSPQSGTAFSAALAAGVAARLIDRQPDLTPDKVVDLLRRTARADVPGGPKLLKTASALRQLKAASGAEPEPDA